MKFDLFSKQLGFYMISFAHIIYIAKPYRSNLVVRFINSSSFAINLKENESWKFPNCEEIFGTKGIHIKELEIYNTKIDRLDQQELKKLPNLESLIIENNKRIRNIPSGVFQFNPKLIHLILKHNSIDFIGRNVFGSLFKDEFSVGELDLSQNKLRHVPMFLSPAPTLKKLTLDQNPIEELAKNAFDNVTHLETLSIQNTLITILRSETFNNNPNLHYVNISNNNELKRIAFNAFVGAYNLRILDLSNTAISHVPHLGLERLTDLTLKNTPNLWQVSDGIVGIPTLKNVYVAIQQRWLCCAFKMKRSVIKMSRQHPINKEKIDLCRKKHQSSTPGLFSGEPTTRPFTSNLPTTTYPFGGFVGRRRRELQFNFNGFVTNASDDNETSHPSKAGILDHFTEENFIKNTVVYTGGVICDPNVTSTEYNKETLGPVHCSPGSDALRPCDDIMGSIFLTSLSWVISGLSLVANALVFCVLVLSRRTVSVTKLLLINLSFADFILAFYLLILVSASGHTHGSYYNYVREWQYGGGCSIAGFLAVFSSQLSMLVLVVITVERYFAIVHAMHFHRRISKSHAMICMSVAWAFSLLMAFLPLVGVNSYSEVAMCLPFRTDSGGDIAYISWLLITNLLFFIFVVLSYTKMFYVVRSPHLHSAHQRRDSEVAKRMGLLVFTDFLCWGPIAFVGLISAFGGADVFDITVENSKFLLVVFFPINAFCNPFLYAVFTNSFKRDFYDLLIRCGLCEESIRNEGFSTNSHSRYKQTMTQETMRNTASNRSSLIDHLSLNKLLKKQQRSVDDLKISTPTPSIKSIFDTPVFGHHEKKVQSPLFTQARNSDSEQLLVSIRDQNSGNSGLGEKEICDIVDPVTFSRYDLSPESLEKMKQTTNL